MPARRPTSLDTPAAPRAVSVPAGNGASRPADPLGNFGALTRDWFTGAFSEPTQAQAQAWAAIAAGDNTLVIAPTGSGKTLAAFLACIDRLVRKALSGELYDRTEVLYVSPLKALGNDIQKNLEIPLSEILQMAGERGLLMPRDSDRGPHRRHASARTPRDAEEAAPHSGHDPGVAVHPAHSGKKPQDSL